MNDIGRITLQERIRLMQRAEETIKRDIPVERSQALLALSTLHLVGVLEGIEAAIRELVTHFVGE